MSAKRRGVLPMVGKVSVDGVLAPRMAGSELEEFQASARASMRRRVAGRLRCRTRGCLEVLAYLEVDRKRDALPGFQLAWYAPEARPRADREPDVLLRVMLTAAQDVDDVLRSGWVVPDRWPKGAHVEFGCRSGHVSRFAGPDIAAILRRASGPTDVL